MDENELKNLKKSIGQKIKYEQKENTERQNLLNVINNLLRIMDMSQLNFILETLKNLEVMRKNMVQNQINKKNYVTGAKEKVYGSRNKKK